MQSQVGRGTKIRWEVNGGLGVDVDVGKPTVFFVGPSYKFVCMV